MTMVMMFERQRVISIRTCGECDQTAWVATTAGFRCEEHAAAEKSTGGLDTVCDWVARRNFRR